MTCAAALLSLVLASGCRSAGTDTRFSRHFEAAPWSGAVRAQLEHDERLVPEALALASIPVAVAVDDDVRHSTSGNVSSSTSSATGVLTLGLGAAATAVGIADWADGDGGAHLEIAAESLGTTALVTELLKNLTHRSRPSGDSKASFPSGHMSFATAGATLLVQDVQDANGGVTPPWAWAFYAPALYVGAERITSHRHWASDVATSAFLGILLPNLFHDAHLARSGEERPTIVPPAHRFAWSLGVDLDEEGAPALALRFGL